MLQKRTTACLLRNTMRALQAVRQVLCLLAAEILSMNSAVFEIARWVVARIALLEVQSRMPDHHVLKGVLRALGVNSQRLTFSFFSAHSVLYLRFSPLKKQAKLFYIGSTENSVCQREHTRHRKFKQVRAEKLVSAELSLRFWDKYDSFWDWVAIPVSSAVPKNILRGREQALIQTLQPPLNFPFIARWFQPKKGFLKPPAASQAKKVGFRKLWRKHRRKAYLPDHRGLPAPLDAIFSMPTFRSREATWVLLTDLGSNTLRRFEASKQLRGSQFTYPALCALHRLAKHLPAYMAPAAVSAISSALAFKGFGKPRMYKPLRAPYMAHSEYRTQLRYVLRDYITQCIRAVTPFHVPKTSLIFPRHPRVGEVVFNPKNAVRQWASAHSPTCACDVIRQFAPWCSEFEGHVAASGDEFVRKVSHLEQQLLRGSMADTFFPDPHAMQQQFETAMAQWCRQNDLPGPPRDMTGTFQALLGQHLQAVQGRYSSEVILSIRQKTKGAIWHCEDHHPRKAICYCPVLYHRVLDGTFKKGDVFTQITGNFAEQIDRVQRLAKKALCKRYSWAFRARHKIPTAYVLPKRKKNFQAGRPIVSYVQAFMRPLLEATAKLILQLCAVAFPLAFDKGDVFKLIKTIQSFFADTEQFRIHCRNQDLSGFFTSIAPCQFHKAWKLLVEFYRQRHGCDQHTTFTVDVMEQQQVLRVFRGARRRRASRQVKLWLSDIPTIIHHALLLQFFKVDSQGFRQTQGSPMGSPISPSLCSMVIAAQEEVWARTFRQTVRGLGSRFLSLRYVDNRLWMSDRSTARLPGVQLLLTSSFYGGRILLEDEPALDFLGFTLDLQKRSVMYNRACQAADLPNPQSAATPATLLSGVLARSHTIKRCSFPASQIRDDLNFLWQLAEQQQLPIHTPKFRRQFWT